MMNEPDLPAQVARITPQLDRNPVKPELRALGRIEPGQHT